MATAPVLIYKLQAKLDEFLQKQHAFICINDNMNKTHPNPKVIEVLHRYYNTLVPNPSQFELPSGVYNKHLHLDDLPDDEPPSPSPLEEKIEQPKIEQLVAVTLRPTANLTLLVLRDVDVRGALSQSWDGYTHYWAAVLLLSVLILAIVVYLLYSYWPGNQKQE